MQKNNLKSSKKSTIRLTKDELIDQLKEQISFLQFSVKNFDEGNELEAKRMAISLRIMLYDTSNSKSLLGQLGLKKKIKFLNTAVPYSSTNLLSHHGLVGIKIEHLGNAKYFPFLDNKDARFNSFKDWWGEIVIKDKKSNTFTRSNLIKIVSNKDGGAHVDSDIDKDYYELKNGNTIGWIFTDINGNVKDLDNKIVFVSIREITFEVLKSLYEYNNNWFEYNIF